MGQLPDVYQYDAIPQRLRVQIVHIINDLVGDDRNSITFSLFKLIHDILCREYGRFSLLDTHDLQNINYIQSVKIFIVQTKDINDFFDAVELSFRVIYREYEEHREFIYLTNPKITPDEAIEELNYRFREHGVGYQYESGEIIRVDSQIIHSEAVKPVLELLNDPRFQGANEEFLKAHEHYRHGNHKECLNECLKAFESTMKIICNKQGWNFEPKYTAQKLINICFNNHLIPDYLETQFSTLRQNLESGIPTMRNKLGGHGQGSQPVNVPQYFAAYQLHLTASTILFLIEAEKSLS